MAVLIDRGRIRLRAVCPERVAANYWQDLRISVMTDSPVARIAGHFARRLASQTIARYEEVLEARARRDDHDAVMAADRERLRRVVPEPWAEGDWPGDVHVVRLRGTGPCPVTGRIRVVAPDVVELAVEGLDVASAQRIIEALTAVES